MSVDDLGDWDVTLKGERLTLLGENFRLDGAENSATLPCNVSMDTEILGAAKSAIKRSPPGPRALSEDDSAMEIPIGGHHNKFIVDEHKNSESYENSSVKTNNRGSRKIEPTWDFMEGCSYDVHNYRVNGGLSYLKNTQPPKHSNKKLASFRRKPPRVSLSYTDGDAYFLPYSHYHTDLKLGGPRIADSVSDMQTSVQNEWNGSQDVAAFYDHFGALSIREASDSKCNDSFFNVENDIPFGVSNANEGSSFLEDVKKTLGEERCEDPSMTSSSLEESSIGDSCGEYSIPEEEEYDEDDEGSLTRALRFIVGMGAFAALHLMK